ncbi:MAG TPA: hypothetical protein VHQ90_08215 [Thermoanaerobaculia bacterium]|nr:hypothetical protein [Thermoanaerobaculia bacterium]
MRDSVCPLLLLAWVSAFAVAQAPLAADVGRWTALGPNGGDVHGLAVDPVHPNVIYAASFAGGGIFKSGDGGASWTQINHGLPLGFQARALAVNPRSPSTVYVGSVGGFGVYKSVDGGANWVPPGPFLMNARGMVSALVIDPLQPDTVYAGTEAGVDKTVDGGATWGPAHDGIRDGVAIRVLAIDPSAPGTLYAGTSVGDVRIYKTTDGGVSWQPAGNAPPVAEALAVDPGDSRIVYAGGDGVFKSTDGGATWRPARRGLDHARVTALAIAPDDHRVLYAATTSGLFKSGDGAATWVAIDQGLQDVHVQAVAIDPTAPATVYAGTASQAVLGGVFKSLDGGATWSARLQGLSALRVSSFAVNPLTPSTLYAATGLGLLTSTDGGTSWSPATGLTDGISALVQDPMNPTTLYAVRSACGRSPASGICRSRDGGATWSELATPAFPIAFAIDPQVSQDLYLVPTLGFFRSTDTGVTWTASTGAGIDQAVLSGVVTDPGSAGTLYAFGRSPGGPGSQPPSRRLLYKSSDRGVNWREVAGLLPPGDFAAGPFISALVIDPSTSALYAVAGGRIVKSSDGAASWTVVYTPADVRTPVAGLALAPTQPASIYAPVGGGVITSADGGATWQAVTTAGLAGIPFDLAVDPQDPHRLLALAFPGGIESLTVPVPAVCIPGPTTLCLNGGRFRVEATWQTAEAAGLAQVAPLTPDTGYLWFFASSNVEAVVKVLNGCGLNQSFWIFAAGLTNVGVTLRVTDSQTGSVQIYSNSLGIPFPPMQDTTAFPACP